VPSSVFPYYISVHGHLDLKGRYFILFSVTLASFLKQENVLDHTIVHPVFPTSQFQYYYNYASVASSPSDVLVTTEF
jgi:hypothetical protein